MRAAEVVEERLRQLYAPPPLVHPYALISEGGNPLVTFRSNGTQVLATYRTLNGARKGALRWGGRVWDRERGEVVT